MYAKVFEQIFDSSISEDHVVRHVFMDLLVLANKHGEIDMTLSAISRRTNVPVKIVKHAIGVLCAPDKTSRTADEEGRRLLLMDVHRDWGWRIVNYEHYNAMRNEDSRREYFRQYKAQQRAKAKMSTLSTVDNVDSTLSPRLSTVSTHVSVSVPVDVTAKEPEHPIRPEMIARGVLVELCLSGRDLSVVIEEVCRSELARGALPGDIRDGMTAAWRDYEVSKPRLGFHIGAGKFFGEGAWRNRDGWPWKEGENESHKQRAKNKYEAFAEADS